MTRFSEAAGARSTLILTRRDVAALLDLDECIAAVEEAFRSHAEGRTHGPGVLGMPAEPLFDVNMSKKDLGLALEMGRALGVALPSVALVDQMMTAARGLDLAHYDFAVVFESERRAAMRGPSSVVATSGTASSRR